MNRFEKPRMRGLLSEKEERILGVSEIVNMIKTQETKVQ
jgi:hypothetical protein